MRHFISLSLFMCACTAQDDLARLRIAPNIIAGVEHPADASGKPVVAAASALRLGSATGARLSSLKYFVQTIQLCQDLELMDTGYSNADGCIDLYRYNGDSPDYNAYTVAQAKSDTTPGRYIDLMSAEGQAELKHPVTLEVPVADPNDANQSSGSQPGVYRFGLINFYRPIKVTAEFPVLGQPDNYFRTRSVTDVHSGRTTDGRFNSERVDIDDTLSGPTEETTYMLDNGGVLFTFQKPFAVTREDVDSGAEIKVDLVFNPDSFGQAYEVSDCNADPQLRICDPTNRVAIDMPFVRMSPVPRKHGERTRKETYLVDYAANTKLRVELYYNDADPEASVQGVDTAIVYEAEVNEPSINVVASHFVSQSGSITNSDAVIQLEDYRHAPTLEGLARRTSGAVTISCEFPGGLCPTAGTNVTRSYSYQGDSLVSAD